MRRALTAAALAGACLTLFFVFRAQAARKMPDFEVYWRAGVRARLGEPLYRIEDRHYQLKYLPGFAVLTIPAGLLPLDVAKASWFTLSVALLAALAALSLSMLPERRKPVWWLLLLTLVAMGKFYGHELVLGQVNLLLAVLVGSAIVAMRGNREPLAGALVAASIVVKPYAIILMPWLLARRKIASIAASVLGLGVALILPAPVYGIDGTIALHREWWQTVRDSTAPNLLNPDNVSIAAMYAKWLQPGHTAAWLAAITALLLLTPPVYAFMRRRGLRFPEALEGSMLLVLMPLLSPQGWDYVFLVATPAVMILINGLDQLPALLRWSTVAALAATGLSLFDVMGRQRYAVFMALSIITLCFVVVIAALTALRQRRAA
jgi:Glycosyltransferase family 87